MYHAGSGYPSLQVWEYGGADGLKLLSFYDSLAAGASAMDLYRVDRFR